MTKWIKSIWKGDNRLVVKVAGQRSGGYVQNHKFYYDSFPNVTPLKIVGVLNWMRDQVPMVLDETKTNWIKRLNSYGSATRLRTEIGIEGYIRFMVWRWFRRRFWVPKISVNRRMQIGEEFAYYYNPFVNITSKTNFDNSGISVSLGFSLKNMFFSS